MRLVAQVTSDYPLEDRGDALAHADAHGGEAVAVAATRHLVHQGRGQTRAAAAEGMAERNGAAVRVHPGRVKPQLADTGERLRGEGFVELDHVEVTHVEARALQRLARGGDGAEAHVG